jgi:hypothetical protein
MMTRTSGCDVHEHDIGVQLARQAHGEGAVVGLADHLQIGKAREQGFHARAHERVVVDQHQTQSGHQWLPAW